MFYDAYIKKSNEKLIEILNSDKYQLLARETAQKILDERNVTYQIKDEKPLLNKLNCFQLFDKFEEYGLNVYTSERRGLIEINQNNNGLLSGIILLLISIIFLIILLTNIITAYNGTNILSAGSRTFAMKGWLSGTIIFFVGAIMNYQRDKKSKVRFQFKKNIIEIRQRKIWKKESFNLSLRETIIEYEKKKKRYYLFTKLKRRKINLLDFKDNNIGNKTEDFLSILTESLNKEVKNGW